METRYQVKISPRATDTMPAKLARFEYAAKVTADSPETAAWRVMNSLDYETVKTNTKGLRRVLDKSGMTIEVIYLGD